MTFYLKQFWPKLIFLDSRKKRDCGGKNYFFICFQNLLWNIEVQKCGENVVFQLQKIARSQIDTHFLRQFLFKKWIFLNAMDIYVNSFAQEIKKSHYFSNLESAKIQAF